METRSEGRGVEMGRERMEENDVGVAWGCKEAFVWMLFATSNDHQIPTEGHETTWLHAKRGTTTRDADEKDQTQENFRPESSLGYVLKFF